MPAPRWRAERVVDRAAHRPERERLGDDVVDPCIEAVRPLALIGIARHQHDGDVGMVACRRVRKRDAIHDRHADIGRPAAAWQACSPTQAWRRRRPETPLAAIRPESRQGATWWSRRAGRRSLRERLVVRFEHVGLRYGLGPEVLRDLTFRIDERSFQFLTGPSGAGKTSLLRLLFLSLRPTRGLVTLFGHDIATLSKDALATLRRRIGIVFQDFRLLDHMTTFENVALPLRVIGQAEDSYREEVV